MRVVAANALRLTGRVAPSANRGRFRGRPLAPPGFSTGPDSSHLGFSVKTTISSVTPTMDLRLRAASPSQNSSDTP